MRSSSVQPGSYEVSFKAARKSYGTFFVRYHSLKTKEVKLSITLLETPPRKPPCPMRIPANVSSDSGGNVSSVPGNVSSELVAQCWPEVIYCIETLASRVLWLAHRFSLQFKFVRVVEQAVEQGVGESRFAEIFMPVSDR